jgi:hypothetical protein
MATSDHPRTSRPSAAILIVVALCLPACGRREEPAMAVQERPTAPTRYEKIAPPEILRSQGEPAAQFAKRVIPQGTEMAFELVEVSCGPPGSSLVILFRSSDSLSNYTGWVLYPSGSDSTRYRKAVLPAMDEASGLFDITVKAVFAAVTGRTPAPELIVLYQYYRTGSGNEPGYAAYVYSWMDGSFEVDSKASASLIGLQSERGVRSKLSTMR